MMRSNGFVSLLAATVIGVYVLVVVGATAALADAATACGGWPLCQGSLSNPDVLVVLFHRAAATVVGLLVVAAAVVGWRRVTRRVQIALVMSLSLYPFQAGLGALVATGAALEQIHLFVGMVIFGTLVLALAWHLEAETGTDDAPETPPDLSGPVDEPVEPPASVHTLSGMSRLKATVGAYFQLMKPRLMWLLCLVAGAGMVLAGTPTVRTVIATLGGGVLAIGASGTFNHVLERDIDKRMERTSDRPLATHEVPVRNALAFGGLLTVASLWAFLTVNLLTAALGLAAIAFYSVVYTLILKPNTVQNTVIGGAAGALPALIGYAAVTGTVGLGGLVLAGVIFLWTPAHFYNLALAYRDDYERGGFPMMPIVRGETETRKHIVLYLAATLLGAGVLAAVANLGWLYGLTTVALGAVFLWMVVRLHYEQSEGAAFRAFHASNAYLGLVLVAIVVDALAI
ncbi:heme o synthase [Natronomonas salsuginis]|uniref:Protoheme IX farnesyltransferase n=1 Tax=Natronomonas salsuginis TaxID=2217661 RepID=A0A4U5JC13_9EURY|nr:protoheme IX farnesyltransferase [Natronomonas salsuginis]